MLPLRLGFRSPKMAGRFATAACFRVVWDVREGFFCEWFFKGVCQPNLQHCGPDSNQIAQDIDELKTRASHLSSADLQSTSLIVQALAAALTYNYTTDLLPDPLPPEFLEPNLSCKSVLTLHVPSI